jgi:hypothetical protein
MQEISAAHVCGGLHISIEIFLRRLVFEAGRRAHKPPSRDVGARRNAFGPIDGIDLATLVKTHWSRVEVLITSGRPVSNTVLPHGVRFKAVVAQGRSQAGQSSRRRTVTEGSVALASAICGSVALAGIGRNLPLLSRLLKRSIQAIAPRRGTPLPREGPR